MTVARTNIEPVLGDAASPLAARLDLLIRRAINVEQFEADMVRCCAADPEEIWNLLGLLDQYHRLEKLPTDLFRSLKAAADRYGLVRREPYMPNLSPTRKQAATEEPAPAVAVPPETPVQQPAMPSLPVAAAPEANALPDGAAAPDARAVPVKTAVPDVAPDKTPFRHLFEDVPTSNGQHTIGTMQGTWQGSRYAPPTPPARRSRIRPVMFSLIVLLAVAVAAGTRLIWWPSLSSLIPSRGDVSTDVTQQPPAPAIAPTAAPTTAPTTAAKPATASAIEQVVAAQAPDTTTPSPAIAETTPAPPPSPVAAAVVAAPGVPSIEFAADHYTVPPGDSAARIVVRRSGNLNRKMSFVWWTENASAVADVDYISWGHRTESIPAGQNSVTLLVPIINDSTRKAPRRFQVVIGSPDDGARLGANSHVMVQVSGTD